MTDRPTGKLRTGWTTGACATAATKAAYQALPAVFPTPSASPLPKGQTPEFALAYMGRGEGYATAGIIKDAGDDPDVTHQAPIIATVCDMVRRDPASTSGQVTGRHGDTPRSAAASWRTDQPGPAGHDAHGDLRGGERPRGTGDVEIEVSVPCGAELARQTLERSAGNRGRAVDHGRPTGIVRPFSCSAWIASIHRGIDVARACGTAHVGQPPVPHRRQR